MSLPGERERDGPPYFPEVRKIVDRQQRASQKLEREEPMAGFQGWHERGYLPHRDAPGLIQFVTFRLADSFPEELRSEWEKLLQLEDNRERRIQLEVWLDRGEGACWLKDERIARIVADALHHFDGLRYRLIAWVIMPNHVHVLLEVCAEPMAKILKSWKQFTSVHANRLVGKTGSFWQADYWDTYMRDAGHEKTTVRYIQNNPVKAGLVTDWKDWPWCYVNCEE